ncbi:MAG: hypothetical protein KDD89_07280, partial [Anaerolineales bacterium]|nr:hypothetical protein [Anaerolineales bacterium]
MRSSNRLVSPAIFAKTFATTSSVNVYLAVFLSPSWLTANIISVEEQNITPDTPAIIEPGGEGADGLAFAEDVLAFNDRAHQHNGAIFNETTGVPDKEGTLIIDLPAYLVGADYVRFANDARDNADYSATVTADVPSTFYLLLDNRINGPAGNSSSPNTTDPDLGGGLQWVLDDAWERVNTGISPGGLPDYVGLDESGNGFGPGVGINQFFAVYRYARAATSVTVRNQGFADGSMTSVAAVPADSAAIAPIDL